MTAPATWSSGGWLPTRALRRALGLAALAILLAAALGRLELVLLVVPLALGTAVSLASRPDRVPPAALTLEEPTSVEGGPVRGRVTVRNNQPRRLLCVVGAAVPGWVRLDHGVGQYASLVPPSAPAVVRLYGTARRWGRYRLGPAVVRTVASDGLLVARREMLAAVPLMVYPGSELFDTDQPLPRASGITGIHRSRRPGEGSDLSEVRLFQAGDRLRRINWRVTNRTGDLHVNSTVADRDAELLLLLDVRYEAGRPGGVDGAASVLDRTVRAAAAIAEHYTYQGDRVAVVEYGPRLRRLPGGAGRRHHLAVLAWLADVTPATVGQAPGAGLLARGLHPPNALVVVLTPLLDQGSANLLAILARTGRAVVAVDTLPEDAVPAVRSPWTAAGLRLWWLERQNTIGRLGEAGVPYARWRGPGSLDEMLHHANLLAVAPRVRAR